MDPTRQQKRQAELQALFSTAPIARTFGMTASYPEPGRGRFDLPYNPDLDHGKHQIHGGVIATLLDNAGWFSAAVHYDTWISTVEFQVRLLMPAEAVHLYSIGRVVRAGKRLAVAEMEVRDPDGALVATGSGTFAVSKIPMSG